MKQISILLIFTFLLWACSNQKSEDNIYALLISKDGKLVQEDYYKAKTKTDLFNVQSITKSIVSLLIGIAIDEGFIQSEDQFISEFLSFDANLEDDLKSKIKISHLLNHTSGIDWDGYKEHEDFLAAANASQYVLDKKGLETPGELYNYNSGGTHLLSQILTQSTGMSTLEFAEKYLFVPLGMATVEWKKLSDGIYDGAGFGLSMRSEDLIKLGHLMLSGGISKGQQIISKEWINKSFNSGLKKETKWGLRKSTHGYGWYSSRYKELEILYAMGYGGQFIFIVPSKDMVIVTNHNHDTADGIAQQIDFIRDSLAHILEL